MLLGVTILFCLSLCIRVRNLGKHRSGILGHCFNLVLDKSLPLSNVHNYDWIRNWLPGLTEDLKLGAVLFFLINKP